MKIEGRAIIHVILALFNGATTLITKQKKQHLGIVSDLE